MTPSVADIADVADVKCSHNDDDCPVYMMMLHRVMRVVLYCTHDVYTVAMMMLHSV